MIRWALWNEKLKKINIFHNSAFYFTKANLALGPQLHHIMVVHETFFFQNKMKGCSTVNDKKTALQEENAFNPLSYIYVLDSIYLNVHNVLLKS